MIERVLAAGNNADRPDPVRSARLIGGAGSAEAAAPLEMADLLQRLADLSRAPGNKQPGSAAGTETHVASEFEDLIQHPALIPDHPSQSLEQQSGLWPSAAAQRMAEGDETIDPLSSLDSERPVQGEHLGRISPADLQQPQWRGADTLASSTVVQLEQAEQWLAELQRLEAQHGLAPSQERPHSEARQLAQSMASFMASSQNALAPRADFTAASFRGELPLQSATGQLDTFLQASLQAGLADELGLQNTTSRAVESPVSAVPSVLTQQAAGTTAAPVEVRLHGPEARWGEQMLQALRDQVQTQIAQRSQHATIRLDPPELGSLDIQISHEQGKLSVQINAGQADIARLLTMLGERLRHELLSQNFTEVSVQVGSHSEQGQGGRQRHASGDESIAGANDIQQRGRGKTRDPSSDILITV